MKKALKHIKYFLVGAGAVCSLFVAITLLILLMASFVIYQEYIFVAISILIVGFFVYEFGKILSGE